MNLGNGELPFGKNQSTFHTHNKAGKGKKSQPEEQQSSKEVLNLENMSQ